MGRPTTLVDNMLACSAKPPTWIESQGYRCCLRDALMLRCYCLIEHSKIRLGSANDLCIVIPYRIPISSQLAHRRQRFPIGAARHDSRQSQHIRSLV